MNPTLEILPSAAYLTESFNAFLLDAYGVFWGGNEFGLLSGSKEAMEKLVLSGKIVGILSNSTQLAAKEIEKLAKHGILLGTHFHFYITSGEVGRDIFLNEKLPFATPKKKFWLFGGAHPRFASHQAIFAGTAYSETPDIDEADFIYISIPHLKGEDQSDPEIFRGQVEELKSSGLPMICPNPDQFAHEGSPPKAVVRQGNIARIYEEIGGQVFYIGKPHELAYEMAMIHFQQHGITELKEIVMIGDTPETDIRGARGFGMPAALITQTGIMADRISEDGQALKRLSSYDVPDYFIERL